jgi:tetratricopeptide (TPR) repeat protein
LKLSCYKVNYRVASFTLLLLIVFPVGVAFSWTVKIANGASRELIVQVKTREERREELIELNKQGLQLSRQGKYKEALELYEKALVICREIGEKKGEGTILDNIGLVYRNLGQYQKALDIFQQSLTIRKQVGDKAGEGTTLNNIGLVYRSLGQYQKALDFYQQSLAIGKQVGDEAGNGKTLNNIGRVYHSLGQYQKALDFYQQSLAIGKQIGDKSGEGNTLNNIGGVYYSLGQYQKALDFYQQSLAISQQIDDKSGEGNTLNGIGLVYYSLGQYQKALDFYQQSLAISQQVGDKAGEGTTLNNIGLVYTSLAQYQKALNFYQQSLAISQQIGNKAGEGTTLSNTGGVYSSLGKYQKALDFYQQALVIRKQIGDKTGEGVTLSNIGLVYDNLGRYQKALDFYQQSLVIRKQVGDKAGESTTLSNIGGVYSSLGQYQKSLDFYQQSLTISQQIGDKLVEGKTFNNIGLVHHNLEQYQKALDFYQKSLTISQQIGDKSGEGTTLNNIGLVYRSLEQYQKALDFYQKSLAIRKQIDDKSGEGITLNNIGRVYHSLGQYRKALDFYQQSLAIRKQIDDKAGEGITLNNIGAAYIAQGEYVRAEKLLFAAIEIWDKLRTSLSDDQKISLFAQQIDTYKFLQQALISQNKIEQALEISERGRARAFIDLLTSKATNNNDAIGKLPTITDIKKIARQQKSTLVEYSVISDDKLYIWIVKPTGEIAFEQVYLKSLKTPIDKLVENSRLSIGVQGRGIKVSQTEGTSHKQRLQQLHDILFKPIAKHLPKNPNERIIFVPHEFLFLVPFPALIDENQKYLIEKHTILTAPAIQVLEFTKKKNSTPVKFAALSQNEKLIVGNPIMPFIGIPPTRLSNLPGSEVETRLIASLLNAKPLIGKEATKTAVMGRINNAKLIHLATHGLLDGFGERIPGAIALSPDSPPSPKNANEGLLRTSEIVENLKLQADLIVLSACDTGKGEITGDGVLGLSRALITAGAKSLIVSLWQVPDKATSDLMVAFYQELEKNPDKARALRQAMLKTKEKYPGAANWAAFTIIGNPE